MEEIPRENHETGPMAEPTELSSPHFDKVALDAAQPVQPLPWHARLNSFGATRQPIAIIIAFGFILLTVAVIASFLMVRSEPAKAEEPTVKAEETSQAVESPATEAPAAAQSEPVAQPEAAVNSAVIKTDEFPWRARTGASRTRPQNRRSPGLANHPGRPVARKIGEIRY